MTALKHIRAKVASLDPVKEVDERVVYTTLQHETESNLYKLEAKLPKRYTDHGAPVYDRSGFLDFKATAPAWLMDLLYVFADPQKFAKKLNEDMDVAAKVQFDGGKRKTPTLSPAERKKAADALVKKTVGRICDCDLIFLSLLLNLGAFSEICCSAHCSRLRPSCS